MIQHTIVFSPAEGLNLDAGTLTAGESGQVQILPPDTPMIDQVLVYLQAISGEPLHRKKWKRSEISCGVASVCMTASWYSVISDPNRRPHPEMEQPGISMIADTEMKRINIEMSYALARLLELRHQNPETFFCYMTLAHKYLARWGMRIGQEVQKAQKLLAAILTSGQTAAVLLAQQKLEGSDQLRASIQADPYRVLANFLIQTYYRNTVIEDVHAGRGPSTPYLPHYRRIGYDVDRTVFGSLTRSAGVIAAGDWPEPWPDGLQAFLATPTLYPAHWDHRSPATPMESERFSLQGEIR